MSILQRIYINLIMLKKTTIILMYILLRCNWYTSFQKVMLRLIFIFITRFFREVDLQIKMKHGYNLNGYHVLLSKF